MLNCLFFGKNLSNFVSLPLFTGIAINSGPYLDEYNRLVIHYVDGDVCNNPNTSETHISTKIIFK